MQEMFAKIAQELNYTASSMLGNHRIIWTGCGEALSVRGADGKEIVAVPVHKKHSDVTAEDVELAHQAITKIMSLEESRAASAA